ncbi:hypothetical protein [Lentiprolixibacter aurantiacus]|uniref:Lipoprotein n=1 Tax=Lentiprolixibacter aurantiacus TaxID=2993939 RepID=A0AAE3SMN4_9FLAO|nr:hypothetical protein [Lentiprolixibacter aurantiacus]MCX2718872.1 hypothetical protein [Lentiprolixibacter aurantiacus]
MKKIVCLIFLVSITLGCSKSAEDNLISRCFIVKDSITELPIQGATVSIVNYKPCTSIYSPECPLESSSWDSLTDHDGEACISFELVYDYIFLRVTLLQYNTQVYQGMENFPSVIYLNRFE